MAVLYKNKYKNQGAVMRGNCNKYDSDDDTNCTSRDTHAVNI